MSEVRPKDVLLRIGGRTLHRTGFLAAAGAGRGYVEVKETFARAAQVRRFRDPDGIGRKAAADNIAIEYPGVLAGLVDAEGYPYCGPLIDGARTQIITQPENLAHADWTVRAGTPVLTAGQADPFGGTGAYLLDDNDAGASEGIQINPAFTGDATKALAAFVRPNTAGVSSSIELRDDTAGQTRAGVDVDWNAGVPVTSNAVGLLLAEPWAGGWYRFLFQAAGVVAANTNRVVLRIGRDNAADVGSAYFFGVNAWNAPFPSSYQGPGESAGVVDSLLVGYNFGSDDITVLTRLARPAWADAAGTISFPGVWDLGNNVNPLARLYFADITRNLAGDIQTGATNHFPTQRAMPAGAEVAIATQIKSTGTTGGVMLNDIGSGYGAPTAAAAPTFTKYGSQVLRIGSVTGTNLPLFGVLLDLIVARGLFTYNEMLAIP